MPEEFLTAILSRFDYAAQRESNDCSAVTIPADSIADFLLAVRDEYQFNMLLDVTAIDWGKNNSPRFTVVYHLFSTRTHQYLRVASNCPNDKIPAMPSVVGIWSAADWHERETYDMFGITFTDHPNLKRILMWEDYPYFPLRKEFPLAGIETELPSPDVKETTGAKVRAAPLMGGPFVATSGDTMSKREPRSVEESPES